MLSVCSLAREERHYELWWRVSLLLLLIKNLRFILAKLAKLKSLLLEHVWSAALIPLLVDCAASKYCG